MARIRHGEVVSLTQVEGALDKIFTINSSLRLASGPAKIQGLTCFDYMFPRLQVQPDALLPTDNPAEIVRSLIALGSAMNEPGDDDKFTSGIPAAYTYFGQFVDHDITLELQSDEITDLNDPELRPLTPEVIRERIKNRRSPTLDLDSVYGATSDGSPVPRNCAELDVGTVIYAEYAPKYPGRRPPNRDIFNDLPRKPPAPGRPDIDREALIGDARNDENLIVSQLHVAFLRAHNALVRRGLSFNGARKMLVQHYQWLIIHDYLRRIVDREVINEILTYGNRFYRPPLCGLYMPLEFSGAAFRFGHSMVRSHYDYNLNFLGETAAQLPHLFSIPAFVGEPESLTHIPEQWIIEWDKFMDRGSNPARKIDTRLVEPLSQLPGAGGHPIEGVKGSLAVRNLLRGYLLRIPIGQKVAEALGFRALTGKEIEKASASPEQTEILRESGLLERTPLWYYILAEAAGRNSLGPVGSTIVAEVLIGLVRWSDDSILSQRDWKPTLGSAPGSFTLRDFFRLAGVWS